MPSGADLRLLPRTRGMLPRGSTYLSIVKEALFMRQCAQRAQSGIDFDLRERQQYRQRHLDLAEKAEDLADYFRWAAGFSGIADFFSRFFKPVGELEDFHRKEVKILQQRAGRPPKSSLRISRQDRSKERKGLRKITRSSISPIVSYEIGFATRQITKQSLFSPTSPFPASTSSTTMFEKPCGRPLARVASKPHAHSKRKNRNECA